MGYDVPSLESHFGTPTRPLQSCAFCDFLGPHPPHNEQDGFHDARPGWNGWEEEQDEQG